MRTRQWTNQFWCGPFKKKFYSRSGGWFMPIMILLVVHVLTCSDCVRVKLLLHLLHMRNFNFCYCLKGFFWTIHGTQEQSLQRKTTKALLCFWGENEKTLENWTTLGTSKLFTLDKNFQLIKIALQSWNLIAEWFWLVRGSFARVNIANVMQKEVRMRKKKKRRVNDILLPGHTLAAKREGGVC